MNAYTEGDEVVSGSINVGSSKVNKRTSSMKDNSQQHLINIYNQNPGAINGQQI
jgi:hypothetical protein